MILNGEKKLLPLKGLKPVEMGHYPELSVKKLYAEFSNRQEVKMYIPPTITKGKQIDKKYFFNVVNTLHEDELQSMIQYANTQRNSVSS